MKSFYEWCESPEELTEAKDELSEKIREALKKAKYKVPAQISVRKRSLSAYDVTIKDLHISDADVKKIVEPFEHIDWDEKSGEILQGANTFIMVQYDWNVERKEEDRLEPKVTEVQREYFKKVLETNADWRGFIPLKKGAKLSYVDVLINFKAYRKDIEKFVETGKYNKLSWFGQYLDKEYHIENCKVKGFDKVLPIQRIPLWRIFFELGY